MITFRQKGDFSKLTRYLEKMKEAAKLSILDKYGREGVAALSSATPTKTGKTAGSWKYEIEHQNGSVAIVYSNTNVNKGVNIAIILQYRARYGNRRLGPGSRLYQSCDSAYF